MIKKDITFIYKDAAEKAMFEPIAEEANKRGYKTTFSENEFSRCEVGFYCQHVNFPQYSKFSVIMLHDIIQQYGNWPDIWFFEPWDKYDIGILPSTQWEENWNKCSQWKYTRPRLGIYKVGWPKADSVCKLTKSTSRSEFNKKHGLDDSKKTILYAPAWENDNKQDDFVQAMKKLNVNVILKQGPWNSEKWLRERPDIYDNVLKMNELHKDIPGVVILDGETNIFEAIAVSDVLVSEESSTLCEAVMMGIPAVSVSDWPIPDTVPSRMPKCDYDFVLMTKRCELSDCINDVIENYSRYHEEFEAFSSRTFSNIGKASGIIMDIIDDCVAGNDIRYTEVKPKECEKVPLGKEISRRKEQFIRATHANYKIQYPVFRFFWDLAKKCKNVLVGDYFK